MRIAIIADSHWGYKNDGETHLRHFVRWHQEHFFPTIRAQRVEHVIHLGDLVDRRKYINFKTAETMREHFLQRVADLGLGMDLVAGNHDVMFKNTNETNALRELVSDRFPRFRIHTGPSLMQEAPILFVPWITNSNRQRTMDLIDQCNSKVVCGHLELNGFKMYRNTTEMTHGLDPRPFDKFNLVLTGHFHTHSTRGNIVYTGSPYEMNWSDADDPKGFWILDTETLDLERHESPLKLHRKVHWDNGGLLEGDYSDQIVKVIVKRRDDTKAYDDFMKQLETLGPADVQVVEDHLHMDVVTDSEEVATVEDTPVILRRAVEGVDFQDKPHLREKLSGFLMDIYSEAISRR